MLRPSPDSFNRATSPYPSLELLGGWTTDVLFYLPSMPVGLGGRYEAFSANEQNETGGKETNWSRVSVLVNSRLLDEPSYFLGPIASIAVSNNFRTLLTPASASVPVEYKANGNFSASLGAEFGYKVGWLHTSLEAGYFYAPLGNLQDSLGQSLYVPVGNGPATVTLSGPYASVSVGVAF